MSLRVPINRDEAISPHPMRTHGHEEIARSSFPMGRTTSQRHIKTPSDRLKGERAVDDNIHSER